MVSNEGLNMQQAFDHLLYRHSLWAIMPHAFGFIYSFIRYVLHTKHHGLQLAVSTLITRIDNSKC